MDKITLSFSKELLCTSRILFSLRDQLTNNRKELEQIYVLDHLRMWEKREIADQIRESNELITQINSIIDDVYNPFKVNQADYLHLDKNDEGLKALESLTGENDREEDREEDSEQD